MADVVAKLQVDSSQFDQKLKSAVEQMNKMEKEVRRTGATFAYADKEEIAFIQSLGSMETKTSSAKSQLREYTEALMQMTSTYRNLTQEEKNSDWGKALAASMDEIKGKAAMLKDAMADVNREIGGMASDTQVFDQIAGGVTGLVSVFQVGQGALQMFGVKSNEAMQAMAKLQGAMAVANGLTKIQAALQKESNLMQGVAKVQRLAAAAAQEMETKAMTGNVAATKAATVAQKALNAVAKANPFMLLASAIGAVVGAFAIFSRSASKASEDQKKMAEQVGSSMGQMMTTYTTLQNEWKNLSTEQEKSDWIDENRDKFNELGIAVNSVADAQKVLVDQSSKVVKAFELQAQAAALQSLAEEKYKDYYERLAKNQDNMVQAGQKVEAVNGYSMSVGEMSAMALKGYMKSEGFLGTGGFTWTEEGAKWYNEQLLGTGKEEAEKLLDMGQEVKKKLEDTWNDIDVKTPDEAKIKVTVEYDEGELGQLQQKLAELRQEQQHAIDNAEFNVIQKDIDAVQKQIDSITGKTDKKATKDIDPLQEAQRKISELSTEALTADEERKEAIRQEIEGLQAQIAAYKQIQDYVQGIKKDEDKPAKETKPKEEKLLNYSQEGIANLGSQIKSTMSKSEIGSEGYLLAADQLLDFTTFENLLNAATERGVQIDPEWMSSIFEDIKIGADVDPDTWQALVDNINQKLADLGLKPIKLDVDTGGVTQLQKKLEELPTQFEMVREQLDKLSSGVGAISTIGNAFNNLKGIGEDLASAFSGEMDAWDALMTVFNSGIGIMQTVIGVMEAINTLTELSAALKEKNAIAQAAETTAVVSGKGAEAAAETAETAASGAATAANTAEAAAGAGKAMAGIPIVGPVLAIAAIAAVLAAVLAATSKAKSSAGNFSSGGIVPGNSYSGDNLSIGVNSQELVLNRAQTSNLASQLNSNPMAGMKLSTRLSGKDILVAIDNTNRSDGGSRGYYTKTH